MAPEIQTSPAPEQGAQTPLTGEGEQYSRSAFDGNQNTMSFCRGAEVPASSQVSDRKFSKGLVNGVSASPESVTTSGMAVNGRENENARPADRKTLQGSTPGDFRKHGAGARLPQNPAPRTAVGQANLNSRLDSNAGFTSYPGTLSDSDAGN